MECFRNQHSRLLVMMEEFVSVRVLYEPFVDWVQGRIELHKDVEVVFREHI